MKKVSVKLILAFSIVLVVVLGIYMVMRSLPFFEISEVVVTHSDNVKGVSSEVERLTSPLKGLNLFEINVPELKRKILKQSFVTSVNVKRYFPDKIIVEVVYDSMNLRIHTAAGERNILYLSDGISIFECSGDVYVNYSDLPDVEISPAYAGVLMFNGPDEGFIQMAVLVESLKSNNLITSIKYDNNNLSDFGRLNLALSFKNTSLRILEPVEADRLALALDIIVSSGTQEAGKTYDLYSGSMVKRSQEDSNGI